MAGCNFISHSIAGSFSRSAVNYNAGAQTAVSNIIMATTFLSKIKTDSLSWYVLSF